MASCNNDKLKAFLTKPVMRRRRRLEEIQEAENQADNTFVGKIFFEGRVLTKPVDLSEPILVTSATGDATYEFVTYVKIFDLNDDKVDPVDTINAFQASSAIISCEQAVVYSNNFEAGDIVTIQKNTPVQQGVSEFYTIVNKIATDENYADKLSKKFDDGGGELQQNFESLSRDQAIDGEIARLNLTSTPNQAELLSTGNTINNGTLTDEDFDYVLDFKDAKITQIGPVYDDTNEILFYYASSDRNGGVAFAKSNNGINYAEKFIELCQAYRQAAIDNNWPNPKYIQINSCFRSFSKQIYLEATQPNLSATPGTSNHGWGLAFDWSNGIVKVKDLKGTVQHDWMVANAPTFGFTETFQKTNEPWHFEINDSAKAQIYKDLSRIQ